MGEYDLCVNLNYGWRWFMCKFELWVRGEKHADRQTNTHTHTHINTMTRPGLGAGSSKNTAYGTHHHHHQLHHVPDPTPLFHLGRLRAPTRHWTDWVYHGLELTGETHNIAVTTHWGSTYRWQITDDRWQMTDDRWQMTDDTIYDQSLITLPLVTVGL